MALAEVKHPPFTRGENQLEKVYRSAIGAENYHKCEFMLKEQLEYFKQKFTILQGTIPITLVTDNTGQNNLW